MKYFSDVQEKKALIKTIFSPLIGQRIRWYEVGQLYFDEQWSNWLDLPLYLQFPDQIISVSWAKFDELAIENGRCLPFALTGSTVRWVSDGVDVLDAVVDKQLVSVSIGKGGMSTEGREIEIWTQLLLEFSDGVTLSIYNALDENGFELQNKTESESIQCC